MRVVFLKNLFFGPTEVKDVKMNVAKNKRISLALLWQMQHLLHKLSLFGDIMVVVKCKNCGKEIRRSPSELKNRRYVFCSTSCKNTYYYHNMDKYSVSMNHTWMFAIKLLMRNKNDKGREQV